MVLDPVCTVLLGTEQGSVIGRGGGWPCPKAWRELTAWCKSVISTQVQGHRSRHPGVYTQGQRAEPGVGCGSVGSWLAQAGVAEGRRL